MILGKKYKIIRKIPAISYAGALIAQNYGEDLNKGFLTWDVKTRKPDFHKIYNPYGYYTLDVDNGIVPDVSNMPQNARLRVRVSNTDTSQLKLVLAQIRRMYGISEVTINRVDSLSNTKTGDRETKISVGDISNPNYLFSLIKDYLDRNYIISEDIYDEIERINLEIVTDLPEEDVNRNVFWSLKEFEFDNMFSYGTGNKVDFTKLDGVVGLFAANSHGKSSLWDALSFCLYDTSSRAFKAEKVLNSRRSTFKCKIHFVMNEVDFYIERSAKRLKNEKVKVNVNFWCVDETGEKFELNGDQRRSTNANIRKYIGTYEDFVLTSLSLQNNFTVFIDKTQKERKELLAQFMGMGLFDKLYTVAHDESFDISAILKDFRKHNYDKDLVETECEQAEYTTQYDKLELLKTILIAEEKKANAELLRLTKKLKPIDKSIIDLDRLLLAKEDFENKRDDFLQKEISVIETRNLQRERLSSITNQIQELETHDITAQYQDLLIHRQDHEQTGIELDKLKVIVKQKVDDLELLKNYKYDKNCEYCRTNPWLLRAIETNKNHKKNQELVGKYVEKVHLLEDISKRLAPIDAEYQRFLDLQEQLSDLTLAEENTGTSLRLFREKAKGYNLQVENVDRKIADHHEKENDIKHNVTINGKIADATRILNDTLDKRERVLTKLQDIHSKIKICESRHTSILETIEKVRELERKYKAYEYYLDAIKRDGVPYELIEKSLPTIEGEVNNILAQIVDFSIVLHMDGKNINTYIAYDEDNVWPLELSGGMERFISSLALRVGLINVCNLPRSNFLAIDEGWGSLDADNINSVHMLFQYLKTQFQFVAIISHLETMRDSVDHFLEIKKDKQNFSFINF